MTDFLADLEHELLAGYRRGRTARRRAIVRRAVATTAGAAAVVAVVVAVAGHAPAERAATPPPAPDHATLLSLRVADPAGGLPWGLQKVERPPGLVCLQYGRVKDGQLGTLGAGGAFEPLAPDDATDCQQPDGAGHAFIASRVHGIPQSASDDTCNVERDCPRADIRIVNYGLLGPEAERITYRDSGGRPVDEAVSQPDGGFLVVRRPHAGDRVSGSYSTAAIPTRREFSSVRYADGTACRPVAGCPARGYVQSTYPVPAAEDVRAPVRAVVQRGPDGFRVTVSARARYATQDGSFYFVDASAAHGNSTACSGIYESPVVHAVAAGQRIAQRFVFNPRCAVATGSVGYQPAPDRPSDGGPFGVDPARTVTVGRFRVRLR